MPKTMVRCRGGSVVAWPVADRPGRGSDQAGRGTTAVIRGALAGAVVLSALAGCGGGDTGSAVTAPGADESATTRVLDAGAALIQDKPPIEALNAYLDGFHFYSGRREAQMEAHHFCAVLNEDVIQCVIYDGNVREAKIMGVEYIIGARLFAGLPEAEKALWHSHVHEVKSGQLVAPGLPEVAEHALMEKLVDTYGKTWHTWHTDLDKELPLGVPQLMMGFTADGQADPAMVAARDARLGVDSEEKRRARAEIPSPAIAPGADAWQQGRALQIADPTGAHDRHGIAPPHGSEGKDPGTNASSKPPARP